MPFISVSKQSGMFHAIAKYVKFWQQATYFWSLVHAFCTIM